MNEVQPRASFCRFIFAGFLVPVVLGSVVFAGPWEVSLLRPDSLIGWDAGSSTQGWTVSGGKLSGTEPADKLLSGWTFGDFQLRFRWQVGKGSVFFLWLPEVPDGEGFRLLFGDTPQAAQLQKGETVVVPGRQLEQSSGRAHSVKIAREKGKLSVSVDDQWLYEAEIPGESRFGLGFGLLQGTVTIWDIRAEEAPGTPMFNAQDFTGWYSKGNLRQWKYLDGGVVARVGRAGDYLRTEKEYGNFTCYFEYQLTKGGNSGIGLRTPHEGWPTADGMELQLLDTPYDAIIKDQPMMSIYGHVPPLARADRSEKWNRVVVKADGYMITAWVNGQLVQHANTYHHPELKHRPLKGWIGFQDHGDPVRVRNVTILEAPHGLGMAAWYTPRRPSAPGLVLDRLLNQERLAEVEPIRSGRIVAAIPTLPQASDKTAASDGGSETSGEGSGPASEAGRHSVVLAELTGPGALVGITRVGASAKLLFYFDGEAKPRIEVGPAEVAARLPIIGSSTQPVLLCLPFQKRLKVVAQEAQPAIYYLDYVLFSPGSVAESYVDPETSFPRGWYLAANSILRWLSSGRYHQFTPFDWVKSEPVSIAPGMRHTVIQAEGVGIVKSLTLSGNRRLLENDDLWAAIYLDSEKRPAIEAPLRFLFAGLRGNFENYVVADQGGPTLFLAMPFAEKWRMELQNRGGRSFRDLVAQVSIQRPKDEQKDAFSRLMRLRGRFLPAQAPGNELVRLEGSGRWVGLVYQLPEGEDGGVQSLILDGRPVPGWSSDTWEGFLGRSGDFRALLSGRQGLLCWRFFHLNPLDYRQSLVLTTGGDRVGDRLILYYAP